MAWAKEGSETLVSSGDIIDVSVTNKKFYNLLSHVFETSPDADPTFRFNSVSSSVYASRECNNGATDVLRTSFNRILVTASGSTNGALIVGYVGNPASSEERLLISFCIEAGTAGAGNAPARTEVVGKWANTVNDISSIQNFNSDSADFTTDSNLTVIGTD